MLSICSHFHGDIGVQSNGVDLIAHSVNAMQFHLLGNNLAYFPWMVNMLPMCAHFQGGIGLQSKGVVFTAHSVIFVTVLDLVNLCTCLVSYLVTGHPTGSDLFSLYNP